MLVCLDKWLIDQASDVPSIIFLYFLSELRYSKLFMYFYFCKFIKNEIEMIFAKNFARNYEKKKIIHVTSTSWSTRHSNQQTKNCRLSDCTWISNTMPFDGTGFPTNSAKIWGGGSPLAPRFYRHWQLRLGGVTPSSGWSPASDIVSICWFMSFINKC